MKPAVFLDRDGVIIENCSTYVRTWSDVSFFPFAFDAIRTLNEAGIDVFLATNQGIVGKGILTLEWVTNLNDQIVEEFCRKGATITRAYLCPHIDEDQCECRKPKPGMLKQAAKEFGVDLSKSVMIGDAISDLLAGDSAGAFSILVKTGRGSEQMNQMDAQQQKKFPVVENVLEAVNSFLTTGVAR